MTQVISNAVQIPVDEYGISVDVRAIEDYLTGINQKSSRDQPAFLTPNNELHGVYLWISFCNKRGMNFNDRKECYSEFLRHVRSMVSPGMIELPDRQKRALKRIFSNGKGSYESSHAVSQWLLSFTYQLFPIECLVSVLCELLLCCRSLSSPQMYINLFFVVNEVLLFTRTQLRIEIDLSLCVESVLPEIICAARQVATDSLISCMTRFVISWTEKGLISLIISPMLQQPLLEILPGNCASLMVLLQSLANSFFEPNIFDVPVGDLVDRCRSLPATALSVPYIRCAAANRLHEADDDDRIKRMLSEVEDEHQEFHTNRWQHLFK